MIQKENFQTRTLFLIQIYHFQNRLRFQSYHVNMQNLYEKEKETHLKVDNVVPEVTFKNYYETIFWQMPIYHSVTQPNNNCSHIKMFWCQMMFDTMTIWMIIIMIMMMFSLSFLRGEWVTYTFHLKSNIFCHFKGKWRRHLLWFLFTVPYLVSYAKRDNILRNYIICEQYCTSYTKENTRKVNRKAKFK